LKDVLGDDSLVTLSPVTKNIEQRQIIADVKAKKLSQSNLTSGIPVNSEMLQISSDLRVVHKPAPRAHNKRSNPHHDHVPSDEMDLLISTINEVDLGWKADVCKLQKHHESYGAHCDQEI
jgi:hypothetical protein